MNNRVDANLSASTNMSSVEHRDACREEYLIVYDAAVERRPCPNEHVVPDSDRVLLRSTNNNVLADDSLFPIVTGLSSPRITAPKEMCARGPIVTAPLITAVGAIIAVGSISGFLPSITYSIVLTLVSLTFEDG